MKRKARTMLIGTAMLGLGLAACEREYEETPVDDGLYDDDGLNDPVVPPAPETPATDPIDETDVSLVGVLESRGESDSEHTGWVLTGTAQGDIEVDISSVSSEAGALDGARVVVTGELVEKSSLDRGAVTVLIAERIVGA